MTLAKPASHVLVTGAAGFIAFHVIEALLKQGVDVVGIDNLDPFYPLAFKEKNLDDLKNLSRKIGTPFVFYPLDLNDIPERLFEKHAFDAVIHLAAKAGVRPSLFDPESYVRSNVLGTTRLLELCRKSSVERIVFGSSSSVYGMDSESPFREDSRAVAPVSPYAATKRACELLCSTHTHLYGAKIAMLRFFTVYGPRQRPDLAIYKFTERLLTGKTIELYGDGTSARDYTFVTDIAAGVLSALAWTKSLASPRCEAFNLGNSSPISLGDMVSHLERACGVAAVIHRKAPQPGDVEQTCASLEKSREILGYIPKVPFQEGVERFTAWFRAERLTGLNAARPSSALSV